MSNKSYFRLRRDATAAAKRSARAHWRAVEGRSKGGQEITIKRPTGLISLRHYLAKRGGR